MTDFRVLCAAIICASDAADHDASAAEGDFLAAIDNARAALDEPEGGTSVEQVAQIVYENSMLATAPDHAKPHWPSWADLPNSDARIHALNTAEIILARWGHSAASAVKPIPVSERLPEDADCLVIPPHGASTLPLRYCWQAREIMHCGQARLIWDWKLVPHTTEQHWPFTYWLPASTRFLPTTVDPAQST
jgi:hypothetical protein